MTFMENKYYLADELIMQLRTLFGTDFQCLGYFPTR